MDWEKRFDSVGAVFKHDGNPQRPYVRLTSGKIANEYFNSAVLFENAEFYAEACNALAQPLIQEHPDLVGKENLYFVGAAMGAVAMTAHIAKAFKAKCAYAEKVGDRLAFERFTLPDGAFCIPVEDAVTTGGTQLKLRDAADRVAFPCHYIKRVLAFWNWSGTNDLNGFTIDSLVSRKMEHCWNEGENPFTPGGKEIVPPVRPKEHWRELTSPNY